MKPKGISWIEQHCEKIFLALMGLAVLAVIAVQFTGEGTTVRVGTQDEVRIERVYTELTEEANRKLGQLQQDTVNPQTPEPDAQLDDRFARAIDEPIVTLADRPLGRAAQLPGGGPVEDEQLDVGALTLAAPSDPAVGVTVGMIDPAQVQAQERLAAMFEGRDEPYDLRAVTVESVIDARVIRAMFEEAEVPIGYWRPKMVALDVRVDRQRLNERTGEWGEAELVPPAPGQFSLRDRLGDAMEIDALNDAVAEARRPEGARILRPLFPTVLAPQPWLPPSLEPERDRAPADEADGDGDGARDAPDEGGAIARRNRLIESGPRLRDTVATPTWAHDFDVEPGATYRYRLRYVIANPLFGLENRLIEPDRGLARAALLVSEPSGWADPVNVPEENYWFVVRAVDGGEDALVRSTPSATVDLFGFYGGRWRHAQGRFEPGDLVRATVTGEGLPERGVVIDAGARVLDVTRSALTSQSQGGRSETPLQVVAAADGGLTIRNQREDADSVRRRELLVQTQAEPAPAEGTEPERERREDRRPTRDERARDAARERGSRGDDRG